ncbi:MAG: ABC transporter substrate-binding protein [Candidatus Latescibacteria bacterium]|nr:ABC transporter substrate-binding protein [Candidatus Latescibacterota bacterium]
MKRFLIIIACIFFAYFLILLMALEKSEDHPRFHTSYPVPVDADTSMSEPGQYGGRVLIGSIGDPKTFNPITPSGRTSADIYERLFSTLVSRDRITQEIVPALAKSWEFSDDNRELTFHMRRGVVWSDGVPVTAYDAEFTYEVIYHPDIANYLRDAMNVNGEPFVGTAVDSFTFKVTIPSPIAPFLKLAGGDDVHILPKHILKPELEKGTFDSAYNISWPPEKLVSCGPFLFEKFESGVKTALRRNPNYWRVDRHGNRLPYLERIIFVTLRNFETEFLMFQNGDLDMLDQIRLSNVPILERDAEKNGYKVVDIGTDVGLVLFWFNMKPGTNKSGKPYVAPYKLTWFNDVRWRRVVSHAVDRKGIIERVADGLAVPQYGPETETNKLWYNPNVVKYEYDLDKSRALLDSMGLIDRDGDGIREDEEGHPAEFTMVTYTGGTGVTANIIKDDLAKVGVRMIYSEVEFKTLLVLIHDELTYECGLIGLTPGDLDPSDGMNVWLSSSSMHMWNPNQEKPATKWEARIDELMRLQMVTLDREKRKEYYDEVQYIISDQVPFIYITTAKAYVSYRNEFRNISPSVINHRLLWNADELWKE